LSARHLARPAGDELLGPGIDVALAERRGIERVEDLLEVGDVHFDEGAARRKFCSERVIGALEV
jgi:hypothetical protein